MSRAMIGVALNNGGHVWYARQVEAERRVLEGEGYDVVAVDAQDDPTVQIAQIRELVDDGAKAVVISATRHDAIDPALDYCLDHDVPVVAESVRLRHRAVRAQVKADDLEVGRKLGRAVGAELGQDLAVDVVAFGFPALDEANRREWGFVAGLREHHAALTVDYVDSRAQIPIARREALRWVETNGRRPRVVVGVDDEALLGALEGFADGGIDTSELLTAAFGISPPSGPQRVDDGTISFGAAMFPELHGAILGELAVALIQGKDVPGDVAPPAAIVTASGTPRSWTRFYRRSDDTYELDLRRAKSES